MKHNIGRITCAWLGWAVFGAGQLASAQDSGSIVDRGHNYYGQCDVPLPSADFTAPDGSAFARTMYEQMVAFHSANPNPPQRAVPFMPAPPPRAVSENGVAAAEAAPEPVEHEPALQIPGNVVRAAGAAPSMGATQTPDRGRITIPTPPDAFGATARTAPMVVTTVDGWAEQIFSADEGESPLDTNHVYDGRVTNGYYRSFAADRLQLADAGVMTTPAGTPWTMDEFHIGVYVSTAGSKTFNVTFHNDDGYYPYAGNQVGSVNVMFTVPTPGAWMVTANIAATPVTFAGPAVMWSYVRPAMPGDNRVPYVNLPTIGTNPDGWYELVGTTWTSLWYSGNPISNLYMAMNAVPPPTGACCYLSGFCAVTTQGACTPPGTSWLGAFTTCSPNLCPQPGACCVPDTGACYMSTVVAPGNCAAGDAYWGNGATCTPTNPCPPPQGACCYVDGSVVVRTQAVCAATYGFWQGAGTTGDPNPCPWPGAGACCYPNGSCNMTMQADCTGTWLGSEINCRPDLCQQGSGSILAWGDCSTPPWSEACAVPEPNSDFVAVAAGYVMSLGLKKTDGSIRAWGVNNSYGQLNVPAPNTGFVGIATSGFHSLGLEADGSIVAWGYNAWGQSSVPAPNSDFRAVAAGWIHSLGLKRNGSIVAWGDNSSGQCNVPSANSGFVAVAAGGEHSLGLKADGSIACWGRNNLTQCNVPSPNTGFVAVAAGANHSLGLNVTGSIVAWGNSDSGGILINVPEPNTGFVAVAAAQDDSFGLKADGSIVAWGYNDYGQTNVPAPNTGFVAAAGGLYHSLGLKNPQPGACCQPSGACAVTLQTACTGVWQGAGTTCSPNLCPQPQGACCYANGSCSLTTQADCTGTWQGTDTTCSPNPCQQSSGSIVGWGYNSDGQIDVPTGTFIAVAAGYLHSLAIRSDGTLAGWGSNRYGEINVPAGTFTGVAAGGAVYDGAGFSLAIRSDGTLAGWGSNGSGQTNVPAGTFTAVAGGWYHSLAISSNGTLAGWGYNGFGQNDVPSGTFTAVAEGEFHSLAIRSDGTLVGWGWNGDGQTNVPPGTFTAVAAGRWHSLAIRSDGTLVGWGDNSDGQINVPAGTFTAVAAGQFHSLAIRSDGTLVGWGWNAYGQINVPSGTFTAIAAGGNHSLALKGGGPIVGWGYNGAGATNVPAGMFTAVAAGGWHSLAIRSDGTLTGWGWNNYGQTDVPAGTFTAVAGGDKHSLAIRSDGTLAGWGYNGVGQASVPTGTFTVVAAGAFHSLAIRSDGTLVGWGLNDYGQTNVPTGMFTAVAAGAASSHSLAIRSDGTLVGWGDNSEGQIDVPSGTFTAVSAGEWHSLAIRSDGILFGWGRNAEGQINVPAGTFTAVSAGALHSLAIATSQPPPPPVADPTGIDKSRFISFSVPTAATAAVGETALRVKLTSLHHVDPPYTGGASVPFTLFEGQSLYVGPPTQYVESASSGIPFYASQLQCAPEYRDWSTVGLLHVMGEAVVPSSTYKVEVLAASCAGHEASCTAVSAPLEIKTTRWGDVETPYYDPAHPEVSQPDTSDISSLVNKFKSALGAPIKARALLAGGNARGTMGPAEISPDMSFTHISLCVDAFKGLPYPYKPGKCAGDPAKACITDSDCTNAPNPTTGPCVLCP